MYPDKTSLKKVDLKIYFQYLRLENLNNFYQKSMLC